MIKCESFETKIDNAIPFPYACVCSYGLLQSCWSESPNDRPTFGDLVVSLEEASAGSGCVPTSHDYAVLEHSDQTEPSQAKGDQVYAELEPPNSDSELDYEFYNGT